MFDPVPDEQQVLASARGGDRTAAEELVERTYPGVYAALFKMTGGNADLSADLTQETYRKAWEGLEAFRGGSKVSTWLFRIAYTTFLNHIRRPARVVPFDDPDQVEVRDPAPMVEDTLARSEALQQLRRAVLALPEDLRFTVTAHYWGELPVKEIARLEGVTSVAIRKRMQRALTAIELALEKEPS